MAWTFGEEPLRQTASLASVLRRIAGSAMALESEDPVVDDITAVLAGAESRLDLLAPSSLSPRVGPAADSDGRVYIDHSRHIGAYNPCFPVYDINVDGNHAWGQVEFPLVYEGPPGVVHGGFLAVFFDSVIQHHNCDLGVAGKTTSLSLRYKRPTPLLSLLDFTIDRSVESDRIASAAQLVGNEIVLCEAQMTAVASDPAHLPEVSPRRARA